MLGSGKAGSKEDMTKSEAYVRNGLAYASLRKCGAFLKSDETRKYAT